jgi:DNA-binding winged helix-turn-helix (wHTH) protein/tetratricopeptide (TPR) repeat protein
MTIGHRFIVTFGPYELDAEAQELRRDGRLVALAPQALRLLLALTAEPHQVLTREKLQRTLWSDATHVDFERGLNSAMRKLRVALKESAECPRYIQTVRGQGYRFVTPVQRVVAPTATGMTTAAPPPSGWRRLRAWLAASAAAACALAVGPWIAAPDRARVVVHTSGMCVETTTDPFAAGTLVAALQAQVGRLAPSKLVVVDQAANATHEIVVAIQKSKTAARVSLRLVDRRRHEQLWADVVDADEGAEHDLVTAVARAVADRLLHGDANARLVAATSSDRALAAFRQGQRFSMERMSELSLAVESFADAVRLDSGFAPAWAALARARATRAMFDGRDPSELRLARAEARRALAVDVELADGHVALGQVQLALGNDPAGAEIDFRRARALGTDAGRDQLWLAWALNVEGRNAEALGTLDEALSRDPRNAILHAWRGLLLHAVRRYDDELAELQRAVSIDEHSWLAALHLGLGYSRRGQYDLALPALRHAVVLSDAGGVSLSWLGRVAADAGDTVTAENALRQLRESGGARGFDPSLAASIEHHLTQRERTRTRPAA